MLLALILAFSFLEGAPAALAAGSLTFPFVIPQQPVTALSDAPSISFFAESKAKNLAALEAANKPASMLLRLNQDMQVQNWDNKPLSEVLTLMTRKVIPMFYIPNADVATAFISFLDANQIRDGILVSPNADALRLVRSSSKGRTLNGMLHITNSSMKPQAIVEACNQSMARSVWLPFQVTDSSLVPYLQKRMVSVFLSDGYGTVEAAVNLAPNGIITGTGVDALYAYYGRFYGDVPTFLKPPFIIAHRGLSYLAPENTMEGNKLAIQAGADIIETDVTLSADGELIILHDNAVDRTTKGTGAPGSLTLFQLRALRANQTDLFVNWTAADYPNTQIPTLREMLKALKNVTVKRDGDKVILLIENKLNEPGMEKKIAAIVDELDMWDQVILQTYEVPLIHQNTRTYLDKASMGYLLDARDCPEHTAANVERVMQLCAPYNATYNPSQASGVTTDFLRAAGARGLLVNPWTYNWTDTKDNGGNTFALDRDFAKGLNAVITDRSDLVAEKAFRLSLSDSATPNLTLDAGEEAYLYATAHSLSATGKYASRTEAFGIGSPRVYALSGNRVTGIASGSEAFGVRALVDNYALFAFGQVTVSGASFTGTNPTPSAISHTDTVKVDFIHGQSAGWQAQKSTFLDYVPLDSSLRSVEVEVTEDTVSIARNQRAINVNQNAPSARLLLPKEVLVSADDFMFFDLSSDTDFSICLSYRKQDGSAYSFAANQSRVNWKITGSGYSWSLGGAGSYQGSFRLRDALPEEAIWPDGTVKLMGIACHAVGGGTDEFLNLKDCWVGTRVLNRGELNLTVFSDTGERYPLTDVTYDGFSFLTAQLSLPLGTPYPHASGGNYLNYTVSKPPDALRLVDGISTSQGVAVRDNLRYVKPRVVDGDRFLDKTFTWLLMDGSVREETLSLNIPQTVWEQLTLSVPTDGAGIDIFADNSGAYGRLVPLFIGDTHEIALTAAFPSGLAAVGHDVTYTSSNERAATVDSLGHITARSIGASTVTARTGSGLTVRYLVNVKAPGGGGSIPDEAIAGSAALGGVASTAWFYESLTKALKNSVVDSTLPFEPSRALTRGEFVQWMVRAFDLTGTADMSQFADSVSPEVSPYAQACVAAGVIKGSLRDGQYYFDETAQLSREQMIVMLVRAVGTEAQVASIGPGYDTFPDQSAISAWAAQAVAWAKREGIVIGDQTGKFQPKAIMNCAAGMTAIVRAAQLP